MLRGWERYARRRDKSIEKAAGKSEQARRPWGPRACSIWLTVLTPANHGAEGFTDRPVEKHHTLIISRRLPASGFIRPDVVPSGHPTPARGGRAITRRPLPPPVAS